MIQLMKVSALCVHLHLGAPDTPTPPRGHPPPEWMPIGGDLSWTR